MTTLDFWGVDQNCFVCPPEGGCTYQWASSFNPVRVNPRLGGFRITVVSTPIPGETNSLVSGQSGQIKVEALDESGAVLAGYRGTVRFSSLDAVATLPADYTFTANDAGVHTFNVTLKTVSGTSATRELKFTDLTTGLAATHQPFLWFSVTMDAEFWKNCGFVSCPDPGSYFCQTAYKPEGWPQPQSFVALTQSSSTLANARVTVRSGEFREVSFVGDAGPVLNNPYWNTGNVLVFDDRTKTLGGCLTDVLMDNLGIAHGCRNGGPFGRATVFWRFGN